MPRTAGAVSHGTAPELYRRCGKSGWQGLGKEKTALLVVIDVNEEGEKELLAMAEGYREFTAGGTSCEMTSVLDKLPRSVGFAKGKEVVVSKDRAAADQAILHTP